MIFVDTSVWVEALRSGPGREATHLEELLDRDEAALPVVARLEILSGAGSRDRARLRRAISALPVYAPHDEAWDRIEQWIETAASAGERFGVADLLVAAIAAENAGALWSLDQDFARMERLGFVALHRPT
ncbi:MAG: PIN domain-containing protein [Acidobacteria bacterium]|nr:PIN domain-containing protein [Acidobacteriota bacterium]